MNMVMLIGFSLMRQLFVALLITQGLFLRVLTKIGNFEQYVEVDGMTAFFLLLVALTSRHVVLVSEMLSLWNC